MGNYAALLITVMTVPGAAIARAPSDRATMVADLLASVDPEVKPVVATRRAAAVKTLDRLGAHPLDEAKPKIADAELYRGRVLGPGYRRGWLEAGAEAKLEQQFMAGQHATIAVAGAPTAPLTLTVAEPGEQPICREATRACRWLPLYTQRYAITLKNTGTARVRYYLVMD